MGTSFNLRPLLLIEDEPIRSRAGDKLNQGRYAGLIAETALGTTGPFTIGVYGGWGQGKTSLLKHAKDLLDQRTDPGSKKRLYPQVVTVFFNAWRYEREAHPIVPLVATIAREVQRRIDEDQTLPQRTGASVKRWWEKIVDAGRAVVSATKVDAKGRLGNPVVGQIEGGVGVDGGTMQKHYKELQKERAAADELKSEPWTRDSLYLSAFDDLESMWDEDVATVATPSSPAPRVVVFVDDLDRCLPEKAFELLEGIKLALAQPGFIFALALNAEIINRYLALEAHKRYGSEHARLGDRYLDKIVQLEVPLRSHKGEFGGFIEKTVMETLGAAIGDASGKPPKHFADAVLTLRDHLGRFTRHTPRTLIRRLNSLIVDERLLPDEAPFEDRKEEEQVASHAARRRGYYMGLILVQRTLVETPGVEAERVRDLHEEPRLCEHLAASPLDELFDLLKTLLETKADGAAQDLAVLVGSAKNEDPVEARRAAILKQMQSIEKPDAAKAEDEMNAEQMLSSFVERRDDRRGRRDVKVATRWLSILSVFRAREEVSDLLQTEPGKAWLTDHKARRAVVELVADRAPAGEAGVSAGGRARASTATPVDAEVLMREVAIIEREIRRHLGLEHDAPVTPEARLRVTSLDLSSEPVSDAGALWLAGAEMDFRSLTTLDLGETQVTDAGVRALARAESGFHSLTTLLLYGTKVTDEGVNELARADSGLRSLACLDISHNKHVTDAGVAELSRPETGLAALSTLDLTGTPVGDGGLRALARPETGLKALTTLHLGGTRATDEGVNAVEARWPGIKVYR